MPIVLRYHFPCLQTTPQRQADTMPYENSAKIVEMHLSNKTLMNTRTRRRSPQQKRVLDFQYDFRAA